MVTKWCIVFCIFACIIIESSCKITHYVPWNLEYLNSINNKITVTVGDEIRLTCNGSSEEAYYADGQSQFDSCVSVCTNALLGSCELNGVIVIPIKSTLFDCTSSFPANTTKFVLNTDKMTCLQGFRLSVTINDINTTPTSSSTDVSGTDNSKPPPNTGGANPSNSQPGGTEATPTTSGSNPSVSPSVGGGESSPRIFLDWSTAAQIGAIVGVAVVVLLLLIIGVFIIVMFMKSKKSGSKSADLSKDFPRDNSTTVILNDDIDGKPGKFASSSNNGVTPATETSSVKSQTRPPPAPPSTTSKNVKHTNGTKSTNGISFNKKHGQESVSLGAVGGSKRSAPPPPPNSSRVLQSAKNFDRKPKQSSSAMKSV